MLLHSEIQLKRYIKLITHYINNPSDDGERHHILPKCIWPEYANQKVHPWNIVVLPSRVHFISHWLLSKAFIGGSSGSLKQAFFLMCQSSKNHARTEDCFVRFKHSKSYQRLRESMGEYRTPLSQETRNMMSLTRKGKAPYKFPDGVVKMLYSNDPRVVSGEVVHCCVGRKNSPETINLMINNSGLRNKIRVRNKLTNEIKFVESLDDDHYIDNSDISKNASDRFRGLKHYHNPTTGERVRSKVDLEGYVQERLFVNPFSGNKLLKHFFTGHTILSDKRYRNEKFYGNPSSKRLYIYDNKMTLKSKTICGLLDCSIDVLNTLLHKPDYVLKKGANKGKSLKDLNIKVLSKDDPIESIEPSVVWID